MLRAIEFKDKRFRTKEDNNLLSPMSENTIILCHNYKLMDSLADEIETLPPYKEFIYPVCIFKGSRKVWEDGKDEMYKMICNGRYGTYDGKWIDLYGDHWDDETHNCIAECNMHLND